MVNDLSYQLYSSRNFPPLEDTLTMLAGMGYAQVEGYGGMYTPDIDLGALRGSLDAAGLSMPTSHIGLDAVEAEPGQAIELAKTIGIKAAFAPYLDAPLRPDTAAGWVGFGKRIAEAGKPLRDAGLSYGWHNHDFEFATADGEIVLDLILSASDEITLELDLAWVAVGGHDPVEWVRKYASRLVSVHLKDIAPDGEATDEDGWADVGHGTMDWPSIMAALAETDVQYHVMEHDNPNDHDRFARRSIAAAKNF